MYRLSLFGGNANNGLKVGRYWNLNNDSGNSNWNIGGSHYYRSVYTLRAIDFMGYVFHCNRTTIRKHTLYRARKKANKISKRREHNWYEASQIISMVGRLKVTDTHRFFERYIQPKVDLQEMRKLVSDHSKKQARERWNHI